MAKLPEPYFPARAAVEALAKQNPDAAPAIARILATIDSGNVDRVQLHASIAAVIAQVCPLGFDRWDDPRRRPNQEVRAWVERAFQLLIAHLDL